MERMSEDDEESLSGAPSAPSAKVGRYEVGDKIGVGAFSDVFVGRDAATGETRALKRLRKKFDDWDGAVKVRDVQTMARLARHPNIVALFEVHRTSTGDVWLVFERMLVSLHDVMLNVSEPLPRSAIVDWTRDALVGLEFLHESSYIHRDVKPENMLLASDGTLKLADFSLARGFHEHGHDLTTYVSTRWYRAPEVLLGSPYGPPADHFAVGCVLAEMFAREALFPADTELSLFHMIVTCLGHPPFMDKFLSTRSIEAPPPLVGTPLENLRSKTGMPSDALEVAAGLVDVDPDQRWTTKKALAHPFFNQGDVGTKSDGAVLGPAVGVQGHAREATMTNVAPRNDVATLVESIPASMRPSPSPTRSTETGLANSPLGTYDDVHRSPAATVGVIRNPYHPSNKKEKSSRR